MVSRRQSLIKLPHYTFLGRSVENDDNLRAKPFISLSLKRHYVPKHSKPCCVAHIIEHKKEYLLAIHSFGL
ncbi:hypothetical protein THOG11_130043 [Vibrio harveyi]|nr:hypothetical protein TH15OA1_260002 [Vibrio harveyi]CAH1530377.1 hypothetical protein VHARVF571_250087 [Vibrio harveyi]CAH1549731.1 hypothetical protein THOD03_130042 [Vibrio harveyi]CAH1553688.1 hypothetical protein THOG11_130043 [Vibrio harveyi]